MQIRHVDPQDSSGKPRQAPTQQPSGSRTRTLGPGGCTKGHGSAAAYRLARRLSLLVAGVVSLAGCGVADDGRTSPTGSAAVTSNAPTPSADPTRMDIPLGGAAWSVKLGFDGVWVQVDPPVDKVVKIDVETSEVVLEVDLGRNVAIGSDDVWVAVGGTEMRKIDPSSGTTLLTVAAKASYVAVGAGSVWAPTEGGVVQRFDVESGALLATIPVASELTEIAATDSSVWVTSKTEGAVFRIDPGTNSIVARVETGAGAHGLVTDESGVWVTNYRDNTVSRIDPVTNTVTATVEDVGSGVGIVADAGAIWVSTQSKGISRIDPATNEATLVAQLSGWIYGVAHSGNVLWVSDTDRHKLVKLDLLPQ